MLETLAASKPAAPEDGRIAARHPAHERAIALRDGFIGALIAKNARLSVEINGKKISAPVAKVENGQIVFAENSFGAKTFALKDLGPARDRAIGGQKGTAGRGSGVGAARGSTCCAATRGGRSS
jgi:hypothetical protein